MKQVFTLFLLGAVVTVNAQTKIISQAIINTKTVIESPDGEDASAGNVTTSDNGEQVRVMRFGGDGETKTTTWLKNDLIKTFSDSEMGRTTVIRDNSKKLTTTIMEMMGRKTGMYATDADQEEMGKRMDSMMRTRNQGGQSVNAPQRVPAEYSIEYRDETKKIAGYECKKALVIATRGTRKDTTQVWYCPEFKLQGVTSTGGMLGGFGSFLQQPGGNGFDKLDGFPMEYVRNMGRGRKMTVQVTKLVTDKEIADKEFEIPKDIEVRAMKDMQNGTGGGPVFQMRVGG